MPIQADDLLLSVSCSERHDLALEVVQLSAYSE